MGLFRKLMRTAGTPEGSRDSTRFAYDKHFREAPGSGKGAYPQHHLALYGALGSWYKVRGVPVRDKYIWPELLPFLLLPEHAAREAIAEYTLYLEEREGWWERGSAGTRVAWLSNLINVALRSAPDNDESVRGATIFAVMNHVAWCDLLAPDLRKTFDQEAQGFREILEEGSTVSPASAAGIPLVESTGRAFNAKRFRRRYTITQSLRSLGILVVVDMVLGAVINWAIEFRYPTVYRWIVSVTTFVFLLLVAMGISEVIKALWWRSDSRDRRHENP